MFRKLHNENGYVFSAGRTALIYFPLLIILLAVSQYSFYSGLPYQIDQISIHLTHAYKTNNISEKMIFMEETLTKLEPYTGNSGWMFPNESTDIDMTKRILRASINEIKTELTTQDQSRWAFLPHNELNDYLNEQVEKAEGRIDRYAGAYSTNPSNNPLLYTSIILLLVGIPTLVIIDSVCNGNWNDKKIFFEPKPEPEPTPYFGGTLPKGF